MKWGCTTTRTVGSPHLEDAVVARVVPARLADDDRLRTGAAPPVVVPDLGHVAREVAVAEVAHRVDRRACMRRG